MGGTSFPGCPSSRTRKMSKALAFLAKKSWHTGTIKNMDKVWNAEQRDADERKKIQELQRELERERSRKELLDAKNGGSDNTGRESLEWMYRGVLSATTTEQELNKPYLPSEEKEDLSTPSLLQRKAVSATQDDMNKVMEDPLLQIKQQEHDAIKAIAKNPVKMKEILSRLQEHEKSKKSKKNKKHKSKSKSHRKHSPSRSLGKRDRDEHERSHSRYEEEDRYESRSRHDRSRAESPRRKRRRTSRSPIRHRDYDHDHSSSRSDYHSSRYEDDKYASRSRHERSRRDHKEEDRGPSSRHTERYEERPSHSDRGERSSHRSGRSTRSRTSQMTEEERAARLQEMENAGKANYEMKLQRYMRSKQEREKDKEEFESRLPETEKDADFLQKMKAEVYMGATSMEERLGRNRHYLRREEEG